MALKLRKVQYFFSLVKSLFTGLEEYYCVGGGGGSCIKPFVALKGAVWSQRNWLLTKGKNVWYKKRWYLWLCSIDFNPFCFFYCPLWVWFWHRSAVLSQRSALLRNVFCVGRWSKPWIQCNSRWLRLLTSRRWKTSWQRRRGKSSTWRYKPFDIKGQIRSLELF